MRRVKITDIIVQHVLMYKNSGEIDPIYSSSIERQNFSRFCSKFRTCLGNLNALEYIKTTTLFLKVYSEEMQEDKLNFIEMIHAQSGHPERQLLIDLLKKRLYSFTREEVGAIGRMCLLCDAKNFINTRPVILPIVAFFIKKRYLFDLIDLRHYSMINNDYNWMLVGLDSFSKFAWASPLKNKSETATCIAL
ncbi:hypothetical protein CDIK_2890 [Cucumispora dikerogammari]|nr:hypothetical protein CDIK_2890 [Cucumispora dikerogammari]